MRISVAQIKDSALGPRVAFVGHFQYCTVPQCGVSDLRIKKGALTGGRSALSQFAMVLHVLKQGKLLGMKSGKSFCFSSPPHCLCRKCGGVHLSTFVSITRCSRNLYA